jgi:hypothetical protein
VQIAHRLPQLERPQHIATDIDITRQVSVGELDLIETGERTYRIPVVQPDGPKRRQLPSGKDISKGTLVLANAREMRSSQKPASATVGA